MMDPLILFKLAEFHFALKLDHVERVVHSVEITPLPGAPRVIEGVFDLAGEIIPVINMRRRFGMADKRIALTDRIIIARPGRRVGLLVDEVGEIVPKCDFVPAAGISSGLVYLEGAMYREENVVVITCLERFLSAEESVDLEESLGECHADS